LRPRCIGMDYMTRKSHQMQKHKFGVICSGALSIETATGLTEHEK
jgi:hypothetical protein